MAALQPARRRGYHRPRPAPTAPAVIFEAGRHTFETDWRDLWVILPDSDRIDRVKITRGSVSRSAQRGYPRALFRPDESLSEASARDMAAFWLEWKETADAAAHPPVRVDHHVRGREMASRPALQEAP